MNIVLPALAVAFAAICVWLGVRIINRRERWAKWTLATSILVSILYVLSFGPVCWITSRMNYGATGIPVIYKPICLSLDRLPSPVSRSTQWYAGALAADDWFFGIVDDVNDWRWEYVPPFDGTTDSRIR